MVENIWCATFKSSVEPLEPKLAATACHLQVMEIYYCPSSTLPINGTTRKSISNMAANAIELNSKTKTITPFLRQTKVEIENSSGNLTTDL